MKYIKEAKKSGAGIVLFLNAFLTAYCCPDIVEELLPLEELENDSEFIGWCNSAGNGRGRTRASNQKNLRKNCK